MPGTWDYWDREGLWRFDASERAKSLGSAFSAQLWPVFESYYLLRYGPDGVHVLNSAVNVMVPRHKLLAHKGRSRMMVEPKGYGVARKLYFPMAQPTLPFEVAKLASGDEAAVLTFVQEWGLLGHDFVVSEKDRLGGDPMDFIVDHAKQAKEILDALDYARRSDPVALYFVQDRINAQLRGIRPVLRSFETGQDAYGDFEGLGDAFEAAVLPYADPRQPPRPKEEDLDQTVKPAGLRIELKWRALVDVVYWHLATYASQERNLGRCEECGNYFERKDPRQRFCPAIKEGAYSRYQSKCGLRYRARKVAIEKKGGKDERLNPA